MTPPLMCFVWVMQMETKVQMSLGWMNHVVLFDDAPNQGSVRWGGHLIFVACVSFTLTLLSVALGITFESNTIAGLKHLSWAEPWPVC